MESSRLSSFAQSLVGAQALGVVVAVSPAGTMRTAFESMSSAPGSCLFAVRDGHVADSFTGREVLTQCMDEERIDWDLLLEVAVKTTANSRAVSPESVNAYAIGIMQKHGTRTLPVTHGDEQVGLVRAGGDRKSIAGAFPRRSSLNPCGQGRPLNNERVDSTGR